jgi:hypothetical protein
VVDIFDEVSDDLRGERAARLLRRYGGLLIAAALVVLLGVAAQQVWTWHEQRQSMAAATKFLAIARQIDSAGNSITNDQRVTDAQALTAFADDAPAGYRSLARLRAAGLYADAGQLPTAASLWDQVAQDDGADPMLRDAANLIWAQHELGTAPDADIASRLAPLTSTENPLHGLAQETQALMFLHEGKTDQAKALFSQISGDPGAPAGVRNRADGLLAKLNG